MINMEYINLIDAIAKDIKFIKEEIIKNSNQKRWLNIAELANYLGYSKHRIYKIKEEYFIENLHFYKKTGKILFDRVAIDDWMAGKDKNDIIQSQRQIVDNILLSVKKI